MICAIFSIKYKEKTLNEVRGETGIPKFTLSTKINKKVPKNQKMGPPTVLSVSKKNRIVKWILAKARVGFPRHPETLKDSIKKILKESNKPNPFRNDRPGKKRFSLFSIRQNIAKISTEFISESRAAVTETSIRYGFSDILLYLTEQDSLDILKDGSRVIICDETRLQLCLKSGKVLEPKSMVNFYEIVKSDEKKILLSFVYTLQMVRHYLHLLFILIKNFPLIFLRHCKIRGFIGRLDCGWMVAAIFFEYIDNVL